MDIHAVDLRRKQSGFISAGAGPDLHDDILVIIGVLGQKQHLQGVLQLLDTRLGSGKLFLEHLAHLLVIFFLQHLKAFFHRFLTFLIFFVRVHNRLQIALFLHQLPKPFLVIHYRRLIQLIHQILVAQKQIVQLVKHVLSLHYSSSGQPGRSTFSF